MPRLMIRSLYALSVATCVTAAGTCAAAPAFAQKKPTRKTVTIAKKAVAKMEVTKALWGKTAEGTSVELYTLRNKNGLTADVTTFGATLVRLHVPDKNGKMADVVLGWDTLEPYTKPGPYLGATIGRVGNRIAKGKFTLDGKEYDLAVNNGPDSLHGGKIGWDKRVWYATPGNAADGSPQVKFTYTSPDGEENYPGTVHASVTYTLTNDNTVRLDYEATTNKPTIINLTNHSYFNLVGAGGDVLSHRAKLYAARYTPVDETSIPLGELAPVKGTPFDLTTETAFGTHIKETGTTDTRGYDHNFVRDNNSTFGPAAEVYEPQSGRLMTVKTDQPGFQLYTANFLDGTLTGKKGVVYKQYGAFCIETQNYPDAINHANFPSPILRPGHTYRQHTEYHFGIR